MKHCNLQLWTEITLDYAELLQKIIELNRNPSQHEHLCKQRRPHTVNWKDQLRHLRHLVHSWVQNSPDPSNNIATSSYGPSSVSSSDARGNQASSSSAPSAFAGNSCSPGSPTGHSIVSSSTDPSGTSIAMPSRKMLYILFGVKGSRRTLELEQINTTRCAKDESLFSNLVQSYKRHRGFWRYWFSIWRLNHCDFVKVSLRAVISLFSYSSLLVP